MPKNQYFYQQYSCIYNSPLTCDRPIQTAQQVKGAKFCLECGFPATLPDSAEIKGNRGTYQVTNFIGVRGNGRIYSGIQQKDKQSVIIKEYLLPSRCFNDDETSRRKETFKRVAGVNLADGRNQNFRLVNTWEAIADEKGERCYLIIKDTEPSQTLSKYLQEKGAMSPVAIREVLNQALQTLEFLHTQKLRLPSNQIQSGLIHGNINLDSILIKVENNEQFYVYLSDLALWENLFIPPTISQPTQPKRQEDLESLGLVAFYLWVGKTINSSGQALEPRNEQLWPNNDNYLKQFLYRLIGLETPFESAEAAREALLKLPKPGEFNTSKTFADTDSQKKRRRIPLILLVILGLVLLAGGIWLLFWMMNKSESDYTEWNQLPANFSDVADVIPGTFTYTGEADGTWSSALSTNTNQLQKLLTQPNPQVQAIFNYQPIDQDRQHVGQPIQKLQRDKNIFFTITSLNDQFTNDLIAKPVAYDGLLVYVEFAKINGNLPTALHGQISLENLRKIYTGKLTNWGQLGVPGNLSIQPFAPTEPEAIQLFKKIVLKNNPQDIADFENIVKQEDTTTTENQISSERQKHVNTGIISFGILTKTWSQCSGYPLAIVDQNKPASQALISRVNQHPLNPSDNFCNKDFYLDPNAFKTGNYPLSYSLFVVYPRDDNRQPSVGNSFAQMLTTQQGQCLLSKVGLVPLQSIPENTNSCLPK